MSEFVPILGAIAGGLFPALAWLWFWRREDRAHPEPRKLIALAFFAGMVTVAVVIPIQKYVATFLATQAVIFTAWSAIEEVTKYFAARVTVLWRREDDEPIDPVIYMVAVTLVPGSHPIIPVMLGDARIAQEMSRRLLKEGIYVISFSYPVVPKGKARIRTQISAAHEKRHLDSALAAFEKVGKQLEVIV